MKTQKRTNHEKMLNKTKKKIVKCKRKVYVFFSFLFFSKENTSEAIKKITDEEDIFFSVLRTENRVLKALLSLLVRILYKK